MEQLPIKKPISASMTSGSPDKMMCETGAKWTIFVYDPRHQAEVIRAVNNHDRLVARLTVMAYAPSLDEADYPDANLFKHVKHSVDESLKLLKELEGGES